MKPVNHISIEQTSGGHNMISPAEFLELPINERTNLILQKKAEFLDEDGNTIPALEAVRALTEKAAA